MQMHVDCCRTEKLHNGCLLHIRRRDENDIDCSRTLHFANTVTRETTKTCIALPLLPYEHSAGSNHTRTHDEYIRRKRAIPYACVTLNTGSALLASACRILAMPAGTLLVARAGSTIAFAEATRIEDVTITIRAECTKRTGCSISASNTS